MKTILFLSAGLVFWGSAVFGQVDELPEPEQGWSEEVPEDFEPLMRGPIHEAYAEPVQLDVEDPLTISQEPPPPVEEIAPETQAEDSKAVWIPGYWSWDDEQEDFIWISGVWRNPPQGREWIPGRWESVDGGYRWTTGWWAPVEAQAVEAFLPEPPSSLEQGPSSDAPSDDHFWIPGTWQWRQQRYVWRPGFWSPCHDNWVWVPDHYVTTIHGCNYVSGYWDYAWERRGILYAPCRFRHRAFLRPDFVYRPSVVVDVSGVFFHLWARPSYGCYYFGDYYDDYYLRVGFQPWYRYHHHRYRRYDPLFVHYRWRYGRDRVSLYHHMHDRYDYYRAHRDARPARVDRVVVGGRPARATRGAQRLVHSASTRNRLSSSVARRDSIRRELLSPQNEQLRAVTVRNQRQRDAVVRGVRQSATNRARQSAVADRARATNPVVRPSQERNTTQERQGRGVRGQRPQLNSTATANRNQRTRSAPVDSRELRARSAQNRRGGPSATGTASSGEVRSSSGRTTTRAGAESRSAVDRRPASSRSRVAPAVVDRNARRTSREATPSAAASASNASRGRLLSSAGRSGAQARTNRASVAPNSRSSSVRESNRSTPSTRTTQRPVTSERGQAVTARPSLRNSSASSARTARSSTPSRSATLANARARLNMPSRSTRSAAPSRSAPSRSAPTMRSAPSRSIPSARSSASRRSSAPAIRRSAPSRGAAGISRSMGSSRSSRALSGLGRGGGGSAAAGRGRGGRR